MGSRQRNLRKKKRVSEGVRMHVSSRSTIVTTMSEDSSEWETLKEETDKSLVNSRKSTLRESNIENIKLFEDPPCTPEMTREVPSAFESLYESPILGSRKSLIIGSRSLHLEKQREDLLQINLPPMEEQDCLEEMNEDELVLHRESNVKTYLTAREVRRKHGELWCAILESNGWGPIDKFLASTPPPPSRPFTERNTYPELSVPQNLKTKVSRQLFKSKEESDEDDPIPPGAMRVRGSLSRETYEQGGRWTRTYKYGPKIEKRKRINTRKTEEESDSQSDIDIYSKRDKMDVEFETAGPHGRRITLAQFRQQQKMMNESSASLSMQEN